MCLPPFPCPHLPRLGRGNVRPHLPPPCPVIPVLQRPFSPGPSRAAPPPPPRAECGGGEGTACTRRAPAGTRTSRPVMFSARACPRPGMPPVPSRWEPPGGPQRVVALNLPTRGAMALRGEGGGPGGVGVPARGHRGLLRRGSYPCPASPGRAREGASAPSPASGGARAPGAARAAPAGKGLASPLLEGECGERRPHHGGLPQGPGVSRLVVCPARGSARGEWRGPPPPGGSPLVHAS